MTRSGPPSRWPKKLGRRLWPFCSSFWIAYPPTLGKPQNNARPGFPAKSCILFNATRNMLLTCSWVKGFCCAQAGRAKASPAARMRRASVLGNLMATSRGSRGLRRIDGVIIPKTGEHRAEEPKAGRNSPQRHRGHGDGTERTACQ